MVIKTNIISIYHGKVHFLRVYIKYRREISRESTICRGTVVWQTV